MYSGMAESHTDVLQGPSFPLRIHAECDGYSGPERSQQVIVRTGAPTCAAVRFRLVGEESVPSGFNFLSEPLAGH